jgi:TldD protein
MQLHPKKGKNMQSEFLNSKRNDCKELVRELSKHFGYVSVLGSHITSAAIAADKRRSVMGEGNLSECGFVIRMHDGRAFYEYSLDDISGDKKALCDKIVASVSLDPELADASVSAPLPKDEPLVQSFIRESDVDKYDPAELLAFCEEMRDKALSLDERLLNCRASVSHYTVSKLFITKQRELDQCYSWVNITSFLILREGEKMVEAYDGSYGHLWKIAMESFPAVIDGLVKKADKLSRAKAITPGVYDVITDPSISGLIAHEAFGHGVEMDQFVKDRALAKSYVGKYVASPICNMRDGAASALSTAS